MIEYKRLINLLQKKNLLVGSIGNIEIQNIERLANDSRKVGPGDMFFAISGEHVDGHLFIDKAVKNGAIAVVCEAMPEEVSVRFPGIAFIKVRDARIALGELAALYYERPGDTLRMIGITGTNGKTTTAFLVHHMLSALSETCGLISTIEYRIGSSSETATHTTPDALDTQKLLNRMVQSECRACVMEVSSHALVQERVRAIDYNCAVFTNLTQDHLDYHGTMDAYFEAKKRLFDNLSPGATAVYNNDDDAGPRIASYTHGHRVSFGLNRSSTFQANVLSNDLNGLHLLLDGYKERFKLVGQFNAYNILAAYAVGRSLGYSREQVARALAEAPPVRGRFEIVPVSANRYVIVDYAHTPDALENVLKTLRQTMNPSANLWCVFGCGGDRDKEKRPQMGRIVEQLSDYIIVTSDNPRSEDPERILEDIKSGISRPEAALWDANRRSAIQEAAARSSPGDVVLIAGKGHELFQVINSSKLPFDDRQEAINAFGI